MTTEFRNYFVSPLAFTLGLLLFSVPASAQNPQVQVNQLNQMAMEAYGNLEIDDAIAFLKQALDICEQSQLSGAVVARAFMNLGMVEYGGLGDEASAMENFKKALCHDSGVQLDPLNSTPDMEILFTGARKQVQAAGCAGIIPQPTATVGPMQPVQPTSPGQPASGMIVNDVLRHPPVSQQKRLIPIPFFVQTNPAAPVSTVILYYRTIGERIFQQLPLRNNDQAWVATIDCDVLTVLDPTGIDYYIAVLDDTNQLLSTAGSEAQPFQISIVDIVTSPPPAQPGETPPVACQETCPPWDRECNERCVRYADFCSPSEPCCKGLICRGGVCEEDPDYDSRDKSGDMQHKVRLFLNGGTGIGLIGSGKYAQDDFPNMVYTGSVEVPTGMALSKLHLRVGAMFALPVDKLEVGLNTRLDLPLSPDYPPVAVSVVANAAYRIVGNTAPKGFQMMAVIGFGWMNVMHRIPFDDCGTTTEENICNNDEWFLDPNDIIARNGFRKSGFLGAELGLDMNIWVSRNVGIQIAPMINILFPTFAINLDIQAGLALRF